MARPRKPTAILELNGAFDHNPARKRPNEPKQSRPLGDPPGRLPESAVEYWHELVDMVPPGVLTRSDRWAVELAAVTMSRFAIGDEIAASELNLLRSLLAALGLTPADRSKLSVPTEKKENKFAALAEEARGIHNRPN